MNILKQDSYIDIEDFRRKKMLLILLTGGSSILLLGLLSTRIYSYVTDPKDIHIGVSLYLLPSLLMGHIILYILIRKNIVNLASVILTSLYIIGSIYGAYKWGVSMPTTLLLFSLIIGLIGILFSSKKALIATCISFVLIFSLGSREIRNPGITSWKNDKVEMIDIYSYIVIIGISSGLTLLSNREIEKSLKRARESEKDLELKIENRTKELKKSQLEAINAMSQTYELGKIAQGLFHDLITPLSSVALYISEYDRTNTRQYIDKAVQASNRMGRLLDVTKKQIKTSNLVEEINIADEVHSVTELLQFLARKKGVVISIKIDTNFFIYGVPIKFSQVLSNILQNAIECFVDEEDRSIKIIIGNNSISISNNGPQIPESILQQLFKGPITTKPDHFGIGLPNIKNIMENYFNGTISITSDKNTTCFKLSFKE